MMLNHFLRFANILTTTNDEEVWEIVKAIMLEDYVQIQNCDVDNGLLSQLDIETSVKTVEKQLKKLKNEEKYNNMSNALLKNAAEMFIYLNSCFDDSSIW